MHIESSSGRRLSAIGLVVAAGAIAIGSISLSLAQPDETEFVPLETSVNALMVALVDHAAHEIWEHGSATTLTGSD
jgi:hypothetical protein